MALVTLAATVLAVAAGSPVGFDRPLILSRLRFDMASTDKVLAFKTGLICGPKGALRWGDLTRPTQAAVTSLVARRLRLTQLPSDGSTTPAQALELKVTLEGISGKLCVADNLLGKRPPTGQLTLTMRWDVYSAASQSMITSETVTTETTIDRDLRDDADPLLKALDQNAGAFGALIDRSP